MATVERVSAGDARRAVQAGRALLVCGYEDDAKCRSMALEGAQTLSRFEARAASLPRDQEIIFYCA